MNEETKRRAQKVNLLLMDCDGVLTDGKLYYSEKGEEIKVFHVHDGQGLVLWHRAGFRSGIITGRNSKMLEVRANELGINFLKQGSKNKLNDFEQILEESGTSENEVAFIGDDVGDLNLLKKVGFSIAVANAIETIFTEVDYVTKLEGGSGAVREVVQLILNAKNIKF